MPRVNNNLFYDTSIKKYGTSARGVQWNSRYTQEARFKIMAKILEKELASSRLVDAGCGFGDFYTFLRYNMLSVQEYVGIDINENMVSIAKKKTKQNILHKNILTDSLPTADYYIASGSLNILSRFETAQFIQRCFEHSKKGFIFNLLKGNDKSGTYNYFWPSDIREMVLKLNCTFQVIDGYLNDDFTVILKKRF